MNELFRKKLRGAIILAGGAALLLLVLALTGKKGTLCIITDPGDAQIFINRQMKGTSPAAAGQSFAIKLGEGEYQVQVIRPSDGPMEFYGEKKIVVYGDTVQTATLKMEERESERFRQDKGNYVKATEMVAVPAGKFVMGCQGNDRNCEDDEKPPIDMNVSAFEIGKYEVTFEMWDACYAQGGCKWYPGDEGWGRGKRPVINVSWNDIQEFLAWINQKTGKTYRLPSEPEWEYAARAGTTTVYSWGDEVGQNNANCDGCGSQYDGKQTAPVGSFAANPWGIYDMHGNVWEWVSGCKWSYEGSSTNALDWQDSKSGDCGAVGRALRGGSWFHYSRVARAAKRFGNSPEYRVKIYGFRLARTN